MWNGSCVIDLPLLDLFLFEMGNNRMPLGTGSRDPVLPLLLDSGGQGWLSRRLEILDSLRSDLPQSLQNFLAVCNSV